MAAPGHSVEPARRYCRGRVTSAPRVRAAYQPHGFNLGMNLGACAGAGIREHFHLHVVPRWNGDANFMSTVGETRVLPEELGKTYERLKAVL